ncbi:MAG: serine/threonine-protein kinase, partial [Planctomycetota bacterium]
MRDAESNPSIDDQTILQPSSSDSTKRSLPPSLDDGLESLLEQLAAIAPVDNPADLIDLLNASKTGPPASGLALPVSHTETQTSLSTPSASSDITRLIEMIKLDMAAAAEHGRVPWIETYVDAMPDRLPLRSVPLSLVMEERLLRADMNCPIDDAEYLARFPHLASAIAKLDEPNTKPTNHNHRSDRDQRSSATTLPASRELSSGQQIDDFEIIQPLGRGSFASVYLAQQLSMRRLVALKISYEGGDRVGGESQTLARLDHPNIVRVFDQRILPGGAGHLLYMQYAPGGTLAEVVRRVKAMSEPQKSSLTGQILIDAIDAQLLAANQQVPERSVTREWLTQASWPMVVAWIGVQLGRALQAAHQQGVLHRDVKPANVLLSADGISKLADFNVSFATANDLGSGTNHLGGSIAYMSPEHLRAILRFHGIDVTSHSKVRHADEVGRAADIYSTGVMLWELWQGTRPFHVDSNARGVDMIQQQLQSRLEVVFNNASTTRHRDKQRDSCQRVLQSVLQRTLDPNPNARLQSGNELAASLRLAMHPECAALFEPDRHSWPYRIGRLSPWLLAASIIMLPNITAGIFNFEYNRIQIIEHHPELKDRFGQLAAIVNTVAFPIGAALMIWMASPVAKAVTATGNHNPTDTNRDGLVSEDALQSTLHLSHRAALIGGTLWGIAAVVYPVVLSSGSPRLPTTEAWHFAISLLVCGGVAAVYPFFGLIVLTTRVYYPKLVRRTMYDVHFESRRKSVRRRCGRFLLAAVGIPLLSIGLLTSRETIAREVIVIAIALTTIGLFAAYAAYQCVINNWEKMAIVLSRRGDTSRWNEASPDAATTG